jgi:hypothetical protein
MKIILTIIITFCTTFTLGLYVSWKFIGQSEVITTLCTIGDVAVEENILTKDEFLILSESTGRKLSNKYGSFVNNLIWDDEALKQASPDSDCSQIMKAINKGMKDNK